MEMMENNTELQTVEPKINKQSKKQEIFNLFPQNQTLDDIFCGPSIGEEQAIF